MFFSILIIWRIKFQADGNRFGNLQQADRPESRCSNRPTFDAKKGQGDNLISASGHAFTLPTISEELYLVLRKVQSATQIMRTVSTALRARSDRELPLE